MAQTTSARSPIMAASVSANPRIMHCTRDRDGRHSHHECRQESSQDRHQDLHQDSGHDRDQDWRLTAPTTRATIAEMRSASGSPARVQAQGRLARCVSPQRGWARGPGEPCRLPAPRLKPPLPAANAAAPIAPHLPQLAQWWPSRAAPAALPRPRPGACRYWRAPLVRPSGNGGSEASGSSLWLAAGLPFRRHRM